MSNLLPDIDQLLLKGPGRDDEVIEAMVLIYRAQLSRLASAILEDPQEAEDAVQQTFISAALKLQHYRPGTNFKAWLYTIAVNVCRGALRRRKTRQALAQLLGQTRAKDSIIHPESVLLQAEAGRQLWAAVGRLDEKQRLVVILRYQDNLSIREIARILSIPEATVYTRLYAAFATLRREVERPGEGSESEVGHADVGQDGLVGKDLRQKERF